MNRFISILLFSLFLFPSVNAKWIEVARNDNVSYFIDNNKIYYNEQYNAYDVMVKIVPKKNKLAKKRKEYIALYKSNEFSRYTHEIDTWQIDVVNNSFRPRVLTNYAGTQVIHNLDLGEISWIPAMNGSPNYSIVQAVRKIVGK